MKKIFRYPFDLVRRLFKGVHLFMIERTFRRRYAFLRKTPQVPVRGEVLIVSLKDWAPRQIFEATLAKALQCRGYTPVFVTQRSHTSAQRYFRDFGFDAFIYFDDLIKEAALTNLTEKTESIIKNHTTFHSLLSYEENGIAIGQHALSTIVRHSLQGSPSFDDPQIMELLRRLLPQTLEAAAAAELLFARFQPAAVLFLEKGYTPYGPILDVALRRKLNTLQFHHGHRSDLLILKRYTVENRRQHSFSLSPNSWQNVKAMPWSAEMEQQFMDEIHRGYRDGTWFNRKFLLDGKRIKTPDEARTQLGLDPNKKTAVIFSHVLWDATFFFGDNLYVDYEEWLVETVRAACENTKLNWIIKLHPDYIWKMKFMKNAPTPRDIIAIQAKVGTLPDHIQVVGSDTDISTYTFFQFIDYCITVRGTVGIEAPCFGIPVFTAGTGRYSGLGFTHDFATRDEYRSAMLRLQEYPRLTPEQITLARKHAYALFNLRPLSIKTVEMVPKIDATFEYETIVRAHSLQDISTAQDLSTFADWVLTSQQEDYLAPLRS